MIPEIGKARQIAVGRRTVNCVVFAAYLTSTCRCTVNTRRINAVLRPLLVEAFESRSAALSSTAVRLPPSPVPLLEACKGPTVFIDAAYNPARKPAHEKRTQDWQPAVTVGEQPVKHPNP